MCGIAGFLYRDTGKQAAIGDTLLRLLEILGSRGVDGTGVALYGPARADDLVIRARLDGDDVERRAVQIGDSLSAAATVHAIEVRDDYVRFAISDSMADVAALAAIVESADAAAQVFSIGSALEIVKAVGTARALHRYGLDAFSGTHGIGHTRLATESRVDVAHCHPFWARPYPDIAVVHNGQITNYHKLRRQMESRGVRFQTGNDSEIIGLYLAERLGRGATLGEAMHDSLDSLDGTFTYLVATRDGIGMARDYLAAKPLIVAETGEWVAIASEEIALYRTLGPIASTYQPASGTVRVWRMADSAPGDTTAVTREAVGV